MTVIGSLEHLSGGGENRCCSEIHCWKFLLNGTGDSRNKQVEESAVGGIRRDGSIASIHEYVVPGGDRFQSGGAPNQLNTAAQAVSLGFSCLGVCW